VAITAEKLDVFHREVEPVAARVFQREAFVRRAHRLDRLQPGVAPDPVIDMDDEVAGRERLRLGQVILGPPRLAVRLDQAVAEDVLFGDDGDPAPREALFQGQTARCRGDGKRASSVPDLPANPPPSMFRASSISRRSLRP
jgi:hypothetical protein